MAFSTVKCEYIWSDGQSPTPELRSKTRVFRISDEDKEKLTEAINSGSSPHEMLPIWSFDGSSTCQATGSDSDCVLRPVLITPDPTRTNGLIVLCEVFNTDLTPHVSNTRAVLRDTFLKLALSEQPRVGFEQEYVLMERDERGVPTNNPVGWPKDDEPYEQGRYYCGVGGDVVAGRIVAESHMDACLTSRLSITGINAEVMLGQWEYQVGGVDVSAVMACDHLIVSRYLLSRISERANSWVNYDPKPKDGDWNGSGLHTNFSTLTMRGEEAGLKAIEEACKKLSNNHKLHISKYGDGIERRLTGKHETASYKKFSYGVSDRGASVRIPWHVQRNGCGYLEDRRPNSNADPYAVVDVMLNTLCEFKADEETNE